MSSLIRSSAILALARFTNFALLFLSPILLVRILSPYSFGQYREFMVYAGLTASLAAFSIPSNLLYFIPHNPGATRHYVNHTNLLMAAGSVIACIVIWSFSAQLRAHTSYDFIVVLTVYVVLFINLDFLEPYWIAIDQPRHVFYYTTLRTIVRLVAVLGAAIYSRSAQGILTSIIIVEAIRLLAVAIIMRRMDLASLHIDRPLLRQQLAFIFPLGIASSLNFLNQYIGQIAVSTQLGVVALAIYTIGSYEVPLLHIIRGAVSDAIFPNMVRQASSNSGDRLLLWKRSNVAFSSVILPAVVAMLWYADVLIPLLFSEKYVESVPLFRMFLFIMLIQCVELSSPLRAVNRNGPMLIGNLLMVVVNLVCTVAAFRFMPERAIFGPAIGLIAGFLIQKAYFAWCVIRIYGVPGRSLLKWRSLVTLLFCAAVCALILVVGEFVAMHAVLRMTIFSALFAIAYFALLRRVGLEEVVTLMKALPWRLLPLEVRRK